MWQPTGWIFIFPTSENEVKLNVRKLSPNKSAGHDDILPKVVKAVINSIAQLLVKIFNKLLLCRIFSNELNVAKVYPVYKCEDKLTISNYNLCCLYFLKYWIKIMFK